MVLSGFIGWSHEHSETKHDFLERNAYVILVLSYHLGAVVARSSGN